MKYKQFYETQSGKLVHQLPEGIMFAYDLCLGRLKGHSKGITKVKNSENEPKHSFSYDVLYTLTYYMKLFFFCESRCGKLVRQLLRDVTFPYNHCLGHSRDH
jgi:hypothetical protein